ncbi:hypothetical protein S40293_11591, partial [Stachybotrys chartarum IBT 40293]
DPNKA